MSCPVEFALCAEKFVSFRHDFNRKDANGLTIDYSTGFRAAMTIRLKSNGVEQFTLLSTAASGSRLILGATTPNISIRITQADMSILDPAPVGDAYEYSLLIRPEPDATDYNTDPVVGGIFKITTGVTEGVP